MQVLASPLSESYNCRIIDSAWRSFCVCLCSATPSYMVPDIHSILMAKKDQGRWTEKKTPNLMDYIYPIKKESFFHGMHFYDRGQLSFETKDSRVSVPRDFQSLKRHRPDLTLTLVLFIVDIGQDGLQRLFPVYFFPVILSLRRTKGKLNWILMKRNTF